MVFGLSEEGREDLEKKMFEIFDELQEKPRIVDVSRLGKPSEVARPVKRVRRRRRHLFATNCGTVIGF